MKYRIKEETFADGSTIYKIQKRLLLVFWVDYYENHVFFSEQIGFFCKQRAFIWVEEKTKAEEKMRLANKKIKSTVIKG